VLIMLLCAQIAIAVAKYAPDIHLFFQPEGRPVLYEMSNAVRWKRQPMYRSRLSSLD
jgi:hypothetical protein